MISCVFCTAPYPLIDVPVRVDISHFPTLLIQAKKGEQVTLPYSRARFLNYLNWLENKKEELASDPPLKSRSLKRDSMSLAIYLNDDRLPQIMKHYKDPQDVLKLAAYMNNLELVTYFCDQPELCYQLNPILTPLFFRP